MNDLQLIRMYSYYLPYKPQTNNGILWGLLNDGIVLTKLENGEIVENKIQDIKLHLNPIEKLIELVDEDNYQLIPMKKLAEVCCNTVVQEYELKGSSDDPQNYVCAIQFRDLTFLYDFYILSFSEKYGFALQSKNKDGKKEIQQLYNQNNFYRRLFGFHINIFNQTGLLEKGKYIIKVNGNKGVPPAMND